MKHSIKTGLSFGLTSGIITTLGLMVGLHSGTHSQSAVIGGILTIAIADAFSDAFGIHISEEFENKHTPREIWESTLSTFFSKFVFAFSFLIPVLFLSLSTAVTVSVIWGFFALSILNIYIAKEQKRNLWRVLGEHLLVALVVVITTHYVGNWIASVFG
ncbi:MAG: hypothetical protein PVF58_17825 [Candidatus Methanofastidiosia archaeon]|jgi:VIT1/CCC1 family predicted Fe2+/Mn2+ transporter